MSKISGITIERTVRGVPRYVRIDLSKHKDLIPLLEEKGLLNHPNVETIKAMDDAEIGNVTRVKDMKDLKKKIYG